MNSEVTKNIDKFLYSMNRSTTRKQLFMLNWDMFMYLLKPECEHLFSDSIFSSILRNKCNLYLDKRPDSIVFVKPVVEKYFFTDIQLCEKIKKINQIDSPLSVSPLSVSPIEITVHTPDISSQKLYYDTPRSCKCGRSFRYIINYRKHFCWQV